MSLFYGPSENVFSCSMTHGCQQKPLGKRGHWLHIAYLSLRLVNTHKRPALATCTIFASQTYIICYWTSSTGQCTFSHNQRNVRHWASALLLGYRILVQLTAGLNRKKKNWFYGYFHFRIGVGFRHRTGVQSQDTVFVFPYRVVTAPLKARLQGHNGSVLRVLPYARLKYSTA